MKKLIAFDLDGTLAVSKSSIDPEMSQLLRRLLEAVRVAIISGGDWPQFEKQVLSKLPTNAQQTKLSILPTCGTKFFQFDNGWKKLYSEDLSPEQKQNIKDSFDRALNETGFKPEKVWGEIIEDRGSQITFSALGQEAPIEAKKDWDPDFAKRKRIKALLDPMLPGLTVNLGGTTSIDITKQGIDKAYGIRKLRDVLGISIEEMVFVGDAIFPGGNDYPAKEVGAESIQVRDPEETKRVIEAICACLMST